MIKVECTPEQAARWYDYLAENCNRLSDGGQKFVSPKRISDVVELYNRFQSIGKCCRDLHMGRDAVKRHLSDGGVLI